MSKEKTVAVPQSFHDDFEIVARYYGVRRLGEYDDLKKYARKSLKDFRDDTIKHFADMANWMTEYLPEPERKGVVPYLEHTKKENDNDNVE